MYLGWISKAFANYAEIFKAKAWYPTLSDMAFSDNFTECPLSVVYWA